MLRSKPKFSYSGLTIILSNPSRFDTHRLLAGNGGVLFENHCLRLEYNQMMCDVRIMEDNTPLLPNTKCLLILGESAMWKYLPETLGNTLNEMRGSLMFHKGIPAICSYLPQDAADSFKNYEKENNILSKDYSPDDSVSSGEDEDEGDVKALGKTKRSNYAFWLRADVRKCKQILTQPLLFQSAKSTLPNYRIFPRPEEVIEILTKTKGQRLYFDIETDYEEQNLQCFAFSFNGRTIYSVPILDYNYKWAYTSIHFILRALAVAIRDNTLVAHNGANFDFFVMAHKYHIPVRDCYDTMIAMHRCFPDIEKSLGHCVSYWTWEKFHKSENSVSYRTHEQMMDRLKYCGKDVYTMYLVKQEIDKYAKTIPGLELSISSAMTYIRPYLTSTLQGIKCDEQRINTMVAENDRLMFQYNRMINLLIGEESMSKCRQVIKGKAGLMAGSNAQCCEYFHNLLGYKVMHRSKKTQKPSLGKKSLYRLALAYENPVITLVCAYRATAKETSRLRFIPWIQTNETKTTELLDRERNTNLTRESEDTDMAVEGDTA